MTTQKNFTSASANITADKCEKRKEIDTCFKMLSNAEQATFLAACDNYASICKVQAEAQQILDQYVAKLHFVETEVTEKETAVAYYKRQLLSAERDLKSIKKRRNTSTVLVETYENKVAKYPVEEKKAAYESAMNEALGLIHKRAEKARKMQELQDQIDALQEQYEALSND